MPLVNCEVIWNDRIVDVSGTFLPSTPDVFYLANGDPGYPGDPAEYEVHEATIDGEPVPDSWLDDEDFLLACLEAAEQAYDLTVGPELERELARDKEAFGS